MATQVQRVIDGVATLFLNEKLIVFAMFSPHSFSCNATFFQSSSYVFFLIEKVLFFRFFPLFLKQNLPRFFHIPATYFLHVVQRIFLFSFRVV